MTLARKQWIGSLATSTQQGIPHKKSYMNFALPTLAAVPSGSNYLNGWYLPSDPKPMHGSKYIHAYMYIHRYTCVYIYKHIYWVIPFYTNCDHNPKHKMEHKMISLVGDFQSIAHKNISPIGGLQSG